MKSRNYPLIEMKVRQPPALFREPARDFFPWRLSLHGSSRTSPLLPIPSLFLLVIAAVATADGAAH